MHGIKHALGLAPLSEPILWLQRRETWAGDRKAGRIRLVAVLLFTLNELVNYHVLRVVDLRFHAGSLLIAGMWLLANALFAVLLREHTWPRATPYLAAAADVVLLTWLLMLADGPRSPLVVLFFLVTALSGMRLSPALCAFTGFASTIGYGAVLEFTKRQKPEYLVPPYHAVIVALALVLTGVVMAHLAARALQLLESASAERA